jgi:hypothetical protein
VWDVKWHNSTDLPSKCIQISQEKTVLLAIFMNLVVYEPTLLSILQVIMLKDQTYRGIQDGG